MRDILLAFYFKYDGNFKKMYDALQAKEFIDPNEYLDGVNKNDFYAIIDEDYPEKFKTMSAPPIVIKKEDVEAYLMARAIGDVIKSSVLVN